MEYFPIFCSFHKDNFIRLKSNEPAFSPAYSSRHQTIQQNCFEVLQGTRMMNFIRLSMRYFDHVSGEHSARSWS